MNLPSPELPSPPLRLLLVGGTGAVGREVLRLALADERIAQVTAPSRRPLPAHPRLLNPVVDFADLPAEAEWWATDAVICTLGTTIRLAGSQAAFAAVDRDLPVRIARLARQAGARCFGLTSSLGASPNGGFYLRTKAQAEQGVRAVGYPACWIVRPSLIDARRPNSRPGERAGLLAARLLRPLIPARFRPVTAASVAAALLSGVLSGQPGDHIVESECLAD